MFFRFPIPRSLSSSSQFFEFGCGAAAIDGFRGEVPAFGQRSGFAGHEQRGGAVEEHGVAPGATVFSLQYSPDNFGVLSFVAANEIGERHGLERKEIGFQFGDGETAFLVKFGDGVAAEGG